MADVVQNCNGTTDIKYGTVVVATGAKRGATATKKKTREIVDIDTLDTTLETRLDNRFDDTAYYTA
jgi:hypothetical protein